MRILLICFLFISQISLGQDGFGKIKGRLNYGNEPAKHFLIELKNERQQTVKQTYTYADGTFYFDSVVSGMYSIFIPAEDLDFYAYENTQLHIPKTVRLTPYSTQFVDITINEINDEYWFIDGYMRIGCRDDGRYYRSTPLPRRYNRTAHSWLYNELEKAVSDRDNVRGYIEQ